jgi:hypothetical protein
MVTRTPGILYLYNKHGAPISYDLWTYLRRCVN